MDKNKARRIAQLKAAFAQGILDEDTYLTLLTGLDPSSIGSATASQGEISQSKSKSPGERAVTTEDVEGSIVTGDRLHLEI